MRWIRTVLAAAMVVSAAALVTPPGAGAVALAAAAPNSWTESAYTSVFKDSGPSADAAQVIRLDTARNDYEGGQVVLRSPDAFTVNSVTFSDLAGPSDAIAAANLSYNFVGYQYLNHNSTFDGVQRVTQTIRNAPGDFPDRLLNDTSRSVPANTTQSIWIRVYVPAEAAGGVYRGTVTIRTSAGDIPVQLSVNARAVTIPPSADGAFTNVMWQSTIPIVHPDATIKDTIREIYKYEPYSAKWWQLLDNQAAITKRYRGNSVQVPVIGLLRDAGSTLDAATGKYTFNWTLLDQVIEHFQANGAVKRIEGFDPMGGSPKYRPATLSTTAGARQVYVDWDSAAGQNWLNQYIPALRDHVAAKGWSDRWFYHVADEPQGSESEQQWIAVAAKIRSLWPGVKIADAVVNASAPTIAKYEDIAIPNLHTYTNNPVPFDAELAKGKELWFYNCNIPVGGHLNRFIDQAQWNQRLTMWLAYNKGATGYLHWAYNNWQYKLDDQEPKGDGWITQPDVARNTLEVTTRYESLRDGIEDWEVLNLLGKTKPGVAKQLARSLAERSDKYTFDTAYMQRIRAMMLDAAAGKPLVADDAAAGRTTTASSQLAGSEPAKAVDGDGTTGWQPAGNTKDEWLQVDLGGQAKVTGVHLTWSGTAPANYRVQLSYDGATWSDAATATATDSEYFAGINGKARYLRVVVPAGAPAVSLTSVEVTADRFLQQNLAGGKSYTRSVAPAAAYGDAGREATDGVLAHDKADKRGFGYDVPADGAAHSYDVTVDLGVVQTVARGRIHAYEDNPALQADVMAVSTSGDGVNFTRRGQVSAVNGMWKRWYDVDFAPARARYIRFTFTKTRTADGTQTFVDDVEVYGTGSVSAVDDIPGSAGYEWSGQELVFAPSTTQTMRRWNWSSGQGTVNTDWGGGPIVGRPSGYAWNDQQHAVARNANGDLLHWWWINGETQPHLANWAGDAASDPVATVWGGQQHIFAASTAGALSHWWWDPADGKLRLDTWSGAPGAIVGRPAVYTWNDQLHVVARGADNHLHHWWWIADEYEPHFADWGGEAYSEPSAFTWNGQQHIFTQAADGQLYHWFWDAGDGLHKVKWTGAPGKFVGAPAAFKQGAQQHVVARGPGNTLYHWWWDQATGLVKWEDKGGQAYSDPIAYVFQGQTQLFAESAKNTLYHWWWTPEDGWHQNDWGGSVDYK
ncbi:glycoside hydrolase domain-containing protein [Kribbella monticola]|uniref:glycoside hydrolase domain-containing protein n=1 Tax=Kribbella monticola TaxID=2185285 RepID=UPI0018E55357|nr:glycoside hydrolase domain-containing protein [Kribbella monticola]